MILTAQEQTRLWGVMKAFQQGAVILDRKWGVDFVVYNRNPSNFVNITVPAPRKDMQ